VFSLFSVPQLLSGNVTFTIQAIIIFLAIMYEYETWSPLIHGCRLGGVQEQGMGAYLVGSKRRLEIVPQQ